MKFSQLLILFALLTLVPASVSAHTLNTSSNLLPSLSSSQWTKTGAATIASNGLTATIAETSTTAGNLYTDISIKNTTKRYALLIAYTQAEDVRDDGDITGLPYIYGYFLDKNGKIVSYLQKTSMRHVGTIDGSWNVSHGTFQIPSDAVKIRYFMKQGSKKGTTKDGRDAIFARPGVYVFDNTSTASTLIDNYKSHLGNIWE